MSALQWDKIPGYTGEDLLLRSMLSLFRIPFITTEDSQKQNKQWIAQEEAYVNLSSLSCVELLLNITACFWGK